MGMYKRKCLLAGASFLVLAGIFFLGNSYYQSTHLATSVNFIMDTVVIQKLYGKDSEQAVQEINRRLQEFEQRCSMYIEGSEIWQINQNAGKRDTSVSAETLQLIERAKQYSAQTDGIFDITVAPLTSLWDITSEHPKVPAQKAIDDAICKINYQDIIIDGNQVRLKQSGESLDLGAIAKGAACNIVLETAQQFHIKTGYASIGGNLIVLGDDINGKPFLFGVRDPLGDQSQLIGTIRLKQSETMATTGGYERYFEENGKRYHHVLDPRTGYPAETDLLSVSVLSKDGALADFLSTTFFLLGKNAVLQALDSDKFQIIAVDKDKKIYLSNQIGKRFQINQEKDYVIFKQNT